jgi:hypothetical protein
MNLLRQKALNRRTRLANPLRRQKVLGLWAPARFESRALSELSPPHGRQLGVGSPASVIAPRPARSKHRPQVAQPALEMRMPRRPGQHRD